MRATGNRVTIRHMTASDVSQPLLTETLNNNNIDLYKGSTFVRAPGPKVLVWLNKNERERKHR